MKSVKKKIRAISAALSLSVMAALSSILYVQTTIPDHFYVAQGESFELSDNYSLVASSLDKQVGKQQDGIAKEAGVYDVDVKLFGSFQVKQVQVQVVPKSMVVPCGSPFGIKMFTEGVMVVGMSAIDVNGVSRNPAREAGIRSGDIIISINGKNVKNNEDVAKLVSESDGEPLRFLVCRSQQKTVIEVMPIKSSNEADYKAGIWVRDSSAGIGTLTFIDPVNNVFGGLGHAVCDVDTGEILPLSTGEIVQVNITGITKGQNGSPGELRGAFVSSGNLGKLQINSETGVYGTIDDGYCTGEPVVVAMKQEIKTGAATILATVTGCEPMEYDILIEKINFSDSNPTRNMMIKITDPRLLEKTGGIVQGMSGCPILQNGKLVGAVTHVLVNDSTRGYAIFAENMTKTAQNIEK